MLLPKQGGVRTEDVRTRENGAHATMLTQLPSKAVQLGRMTLRSTAPGGGCPSQDKRAALPRGCPTEVPSAPQSCLVPPGTSTLQVPHL